MIRSSPSFLIFGFHFGSLRRMAWMILGAALFPALGVPPTPISITVPTRTNDVSFRREILPLLQANCLPCHNQTRAKANLNLETPSTMVRGGDTGTALTPGKPAESLLLRTAAHQVEDLVMPPAENKANARNLTPEELGLISLWISQGGHADGGEVDTPAWKPIATQWLSSFAIALSPSGHSVAVARANRIYLHDLQTGKRLSRLQDPSLDGAAQRDLVGSLAFSPDESRIAAGGFREVRLWKRQPASISGTTFSWTNGSSVAAWFAPDYSRMARLTAAGHIEVRAQGKSEPLIDWALPTGAEPASVRLAWTPDSHWLALSFGNGTLQLLSSETNLVGTNLVVGTPVTSLAWWDEGRQLAVALSGTNTLHRFRRIGSPEAPALESAGEFSGSPELFVTVVAAPGKDGSVIASGPGGTVRRWPSDPTGPSQDIRVEGPVLRLETGRTNPQVAVALANGGLQMLTFGDKSTHSPRLNLDSTPLLLQTNADFELALSRLEQTRAGGLKNEAEASKKASEETLAKAKEKREGHSKIVADLEKELAHQHELEAAATRERDELAAELDRTAKAFAAADAARQEGIATARQMAEQDATLRAEAAIATRLKTELERLVAGLPSGETNPASGRIREALALAATASEAAEHKSADSRNQAIKSVEESSGKAFTAGQRKAEADRAQADLPPRKKQAEERLAAAQKAINDQTMPLAKARIALDGSTQDVALAEKNLAKASSALAEAGAAEEAAKSRIQEAERRLASANAEMQRASALMAQALAVSASSSEVLAIDGLGHAHCFSEAGRSLGVPVDLGNTHILAAACPTDHGFLIALPDSVVRLDTQQVWTLERTLGGSDASGAPGPFVDRINAVAFSPDGQLLATGGGDPSRAGELKLWKVSDGSLVRDFGALHSDCVTSIAFSPRGEWLATGGADRFGRITPVQGDGPRLTLEGHTHHVIGVAWLADGSTLATAGAEGVVKLWDPKTGERRGNVDGFGKEVVGLHPVGLTPNFVAMGANGHGRIVKSNGEKLRDLNAAPEYLQTVAVTRDGQWAVGADDHGIVSVWNLTTGEIHREVSSTGTPEGL